MTVIKRLAWICAFALIGAMSCADIFVRSCTLGHFLMLDSFSPQSTPGYALYPGDQLATFVSYNSGDGENLGENCSEFLYSSTQKPELFTWLSSDSTVFTVDDKGKLVAKGLGAAQLTVQSGSEIITANVRVTPAVASIRITATPVTPKVGDTVTVVIDALDAQGAIVEGALLSTPSLHQDPAAWPLWISVDAHGGTFRVANAQPWHVWSIASHSLPPLVMTRIEVKPQ